MSAVAIWIFVQIGFIGSAQGTLLINEFMASNVAAIADEYGDYDDWLEIYNSGSVAIDLGGYYVSDDPSDLSVHRIASGYAEMTTIEPGGYLVLWADGQMDQGPLHLDFRLSRDSEAVLLIDTTGMTILDHRVYSAQYTDISFGRSPDGADNWRYFTEFTPGGSNGSGYSGVTAPPTIAEISGFYDAGFSVSMTPNHPEDRIYYTLDGSDPDEYSIMYNDEPIPLSVSTVLRASSIRDQYAPSAIITRNFYIQQVHALPVLSIVTDPANLFDEEIGIYENYEESGREWERRVNVQYFRDNTQQFDIDAGIRIQGNSSVDMPKKSFRLFFRNGYGAGRLEYPMFEHTAVHSFKNLVLRSGYDEDLQKENGTLLRDPLVSELWRQMGELVSHGNFAVLYLNNDFWGIYNIREEVNEDFVWDYGFEADVDLIRYRWGSWETAYGSAVEWNALLDFFENNSLETDEQLVVAGARIDIDNYTLLHVFEHAAQYRSWYYGASAVKNRRPGSRWQWTIWDMDRAYADLLWDGFSYYGDTTGIYRNNRFISRLLGNRDYREYFINRHCDLLSTLFEPDYVIAILDSLAELIEPEIPAAATRWGTSPEAWSANVDSLRQFIHQRPGIVREQMRRYFNLGDDVELILSNPEGNGQIKVNTVEIKRFPWRGRYFVGIPNTVVAIPGAGYRFVGWSDPSLPTADSISIVLDDDMTLSARFEPINSGINNDGYANEIPREYALKQNYPNPFNPITVIRYSIARDSRVRIAVYNLTGELQDILVDRIQEAGYYQVEFNSDNYASGVYFYHLSAAGFSCVKKMVLIK